MKKGDRGVRRGFEELRLLVIRVMNDGELLCAFSLRVGLTLGVVRLSAEQDQVPDGFGQILLSPTDFVVEHSWQHEEPAGGLVLCRWQDEFGDHEAVFFESMVEVAE